MKTFLRYLDVYSYDIKMKINDREKISSLIGILLSILTFFVLIVFSWLIGNDFIYRTNPNSYMDQNIGKAYPRINLTREFAPLAFGFSDEYGYPFLNESILIFKFLKYSYTLNETLSAFNDPVVTQIELENCNSNNFPSVSKEEFDHAALLGFYCPKNYDELYVEGSWISQNLTYLMFEVYKCDYDTDPEKCATEQEIEKVIAGNLLNYNLFYVGNNIALGNFSNPLIGRIVNKYKYIHPKNNKLTNIFVQKNKIFTDVAFLSSNFDELEYSKIEEIDTDIINLDNKNKRLASFVFYANNKSDYYYRTYIKISEILASVGGLIKILFLFFSFIIRPFYRLEKFNLIYNKIENDEDIVNFIERKSNFSLKLNNSYTFSNNIICNNNSSNKIEENKKITNIDSSQINNQTKHDSNVEINNLHKSKYSKNVKVINDLRIQII
jgi:hypothetical protein